MCRIKRPYSGQRQALCAELKLRTVDRDRHYVQNERTVHCMETGIMCRINGPYNGQRQALCAELKVRTLYGDRHYVQN